MLEAALISFALILAAWVVAPNGPRVARESTTLPSVSTASARA